MEYILTSGTNDLNFLMCPTGSEAPVFVMYLKELRSNRSRFLSFSNSAEMVGTIGKPVTFSCSIFFKIFTG